MPSKKKARKRQDVPRPRNGGQWTEARFISFVKSALRGAMWPPKYEAIRKAYVGDGVNPSTGRKCKLHLCPECGGTFPQNGMQADHVIAVVGPEGFVSWNLFIERLFVEAEGFRAVCRACHKRITDAERAERAAHSSKPPGADQLL